MFGKNVSMLCPTRITHKDCTIYLLKGTTFVPAAAPGTCFLHVLDDTGIVQPHFAIPKIRIKHFPSSDDEAWEVGHVTVTTDKATCIPGLSHIVTQCFLTAGV